LDKPIITNNLLLIGFCHRFGDKVRDQIQVGPRASQVKIMVKIESVVGGGLKETRFVAWGPLRWPEHHHKVVVVDCLSVCRAGVCPASVFQAKWGPARKSQKYMEGGITNLSS
jgi:hypothetical protein